MRGEAEGHMVSNERQCGLTFRFYFTKKKKKNHTETISSMVASSSDMLQNNTSTKHTLQKFTLWIMEVKTSCFIYIYIFFFTAHRKNNIGLIKNKKGTILKSLHTHFFFSRHELHQKITFRSSHGHAAEDLTHDLWPSLESLCFSPSRLPSWQCYCLRLIILLEWLLRTLLKRSSEETENEAEQIQMRVACSRN